MDLLVVLVAQARLVPLGSKAPVVPKATKAIVVCAVHKDFVVRRAWLVLEDHVVTRESKDCVVLLDRLVLVDCREFKEK